MAFAFRQTQTLERKPALNAAPKLNTMKKASAFFFLRNSYQNLLRNSYKNFLRKKRPCARKNFLKKS